MSAGRCLPWGGARHLAELTAEGETDSTILLVSEYFQVYRKKSKIISIFFIFKLFQVVIQLGFVNKNGYKKLKC